MSALILALQLKANSLTILSFTLLICKIGSDRICVFFPSQRCWEEQMRYCMYKLWSLIKEVLLSLLEDLLNQVMLWLSSIEHSFCGFTIIL